MDFIELTTWIDELKKIPTGKCLSPRFLKPLHLITLGLVAKQGDWKNFNLPASLENYALRMKLWDSVGVAPPRRVKESDSHDRFLPVQSFHEGKRDVQFVVDHLTRIVLKTTAKEYCDSLSICLLEIVNNFFDHAK